MTLIIHTLKVIYFHDTYHLWQPLFLVNHNDYWIVGYWLSILCLLVLHEIIYNATENKHVYKTYSRQTVPLFTFWGLKHNHTKVNKPPSLYLSSKYRVYAPCSNTKFCIPGTCVILRLKYISVIRWP